MATKTNTPRPSAAQIHANQKERRRRRLARKAANRDNRR